VDLGVGHRKPKLVSALDEAFFIVLVGTKLDLLEHLYEREKLELGLKSESFLHLTGEGDWDHSGQTLGDMLRA